MMEQLWLPILTMITGMTTHKKECIRLQMMRFLNILPVPMQTTMGLWQTSGFCFIFAKYLCFYPRTGCLRFEFDDGITNGADWYSLTGGMMDYSYIFTSCAEITIELSCCKYPNK